MSVATMMRTTLPLHRPRLASTSSTHPSLDVFAPACTSMHQRGVFSTGTVRDLLSCAQNAPRSCVSSDSVPSSAATAISER